MTDINRRQGPGVGATVNAWKEMNRDLIKKASDVADVVQLMTSASNSLISPEEKLHALILVKASAPLSEAANARISKEIGELAQFTHRHPPL